MNNKTETQLSIQNISETARRLFWLYRILPRDESKALSAKAIEQKYEYCELYQTQDNALSKRKTLNNDLHQLHRIFATDDKHICRMPDWHEESKGKTVKYWINPNQQLMQLSQQQYFIMVMVQHFMQDYLPVHIQKEVDNFVSLFEAKKPRNSTDDAPHKWQQRIFAMPELLQPPDINADVLAAIHTAIFENKQITFDYQKKWHEQTEQKTLYPVGIVLQGNNMYLSGFYSVKGILRDKKILKEHRLFAIQRISKVKQTEVEVPNELLTTDFSLEKLYEKGKLHPQNIIQDNGEVTIQPGQKLSLTMRVNQWAMQHLIERPFSESQKYTHAEDGYYHVKVNIVATDELMYWLMSMGSNIQVLSPDFIKDEIMQRHQTAYEAYLAMY